MISPSIRRNSNSNYFQILDQEDVPKNELTSEVIQDAVSKIGISYAIHPLIAGSTSVEKAEKAFLKLKNQGVKPDVYHFNALMSVYAKYRPAYAHQIIPRMKEMGVSPSLYTYNILIDAYAESKNLKAALTVFNNIMVKENVIPDIVTVNSLLKACRNCERGDLAKTLYEKNISQGFKPTLYTINILVAIFPPEEGYAFAKKEMLEYQITPDLCTFATSIRKFEEHKLGLRLWEIYQEMPKEIIPNNQMLSSVLKSLVDLEMYADAHKVYDTMRAYGHQVNTSSAPYVIELLLSDNQFAAAKHLYYKFLKQNIKDDLHCENTLCGVAYLLMQSNLSKNPITVFLGPDPSKKEKFLKLLKNSDNLEWKELGSGAIKVRSSSE